MPRPQNNNLREYFIEKNEIVVICENEKCEGKELIAKCGNMERHLKSRHPNIYLKYLKKKHSSKQNSLKGKISTEVVKEEVEQNIITLFTKNGRPFSMLDDEAFKYFVQPFFEVFNMNINSHNIHQIIANYCSEMQAIIIEDLNGKCISLKIDSASRMHMSVLGINVQYVKGNKIIIKTLAVKELKASHTSSYLKNIIYDVLKSYQIDIKQILTITTDNGANMTKTVRDMSDDLEYSFEYDDFKVNNMELMESALAEPNITNIRCGAHTLQLCVNDFLKKMDYSKKIEQLRAIVRKLRSPTYTLRLIDGNYKKPILDCPTRWNSTYKMLERLIELKPFIHYIDNNNLEIDNEMWMFSENMVKVLKPIFIATMKLQSEELCYSDLYVIIMDVILEIDQLPDSCHKTSISECLQCRKPQLLENDLCNAAAFLDPRIKVFLKDDEKVRAKKTILKLHQRISSLNSKYIK